MRNKYPIIIIGAGASGLMAAIEAARARPRSVLLVDKESRAGRKLLATGNGRCNLLNTGPVETQYHGSGAQIAENLLSHLPAKDLATYFADLGLLCREETAGRVYPYSGQASSVIDVLRLACDRHGVEIRTDTTINSIHQTRDGFLLQTNNADTLHAEQLLIAGGGKASPNLGSDGSALQLLASLGHAVSPMFPALVPLKVPAESIRGLKGVRTQATVTLCVDNEPCRAEIGEILFSDYGVSGIAVMQLSRHANVALSRKQHVTLQIQLMNEATAHEETARRVALFSQSTMEHFCTGLLHKRIAQCLLRAAGIDLHAPVSSASASRLQQLLSCWCLPVTGSLPFAQAQITAGGALLDAFDPDTLASRLVPGLYACGEVLDVDGNCGGYNLMWAWASGITAARAMTAKGGQA